MSLNINARNLHHAYCIVGDAESTLADLYKFFKKELNFNVEGNPDFWYGEYDNMNMEEARDLKNLHQNKPVAGDKKIFVLSANFINEKAQNALLKIFEEPLGDTHFFLIMPSAGGLIPTLKSRLLITEHESLGKTKTNAKAFLKASVGERMNIVKMLAESVSDKEESKIEIVKFLNSLEAEFSNLPSKNLERLKNIETLENVRSYASDPSPSLKMLLEYLALNLPTI